MTREMTSISPAVVASRINDPFVLHSIFSFGVKPRQVLLRNAASKAIQRWYRKYRKIDYDSYSGMVRTIFREYPDNYIYNYPAFSVFKLRNIKPLDLISWQWSRRSQIRLWIMWNLDISDLAYVGI